MKNALVFIALFCSLRLCAGVEDPLVQMMPGTLFVPYPANTTVNPALPVNKILGPTPFVIGSTTWSTGFALKSVTNLVKLYSDQNNTVIVNFDYELRVPVVIKYFKNGVGPAITLSTETLTISYHPDPNVQREYRQTDAFRFADGCQVEVTVQTSGITGKRLNSTPLTALEMERVAKTVFLQSEIAVERYFNFNPTTLLCPSDITLTPQTADNSLEVKWRTMLNPTTPLGAEEYDVEWVYVDDYDNVSGSTITYKNAGLLNYNFNQNAARVQVRSDSYRIPLVYEHGYLLVRVRPIGRSAADNFTAPIPGVWSCGIATCAPGCNTSAGIVGSYLNRYFINTAHENDRKNWQAVTTYAEQGKRKDVVSYYDGTMRNRQSVTGLSTEKLTLVGETIYDYQGRGAIQALPAPVNDATLRYFSNFNQNTAGQPYNRDNFDKNDPSCANPAETMLPNNNGASKYYSTFNPDKMGFNALIPNAEGYPFTRTEYTPDNTGRIARQGGVGPAHQLGSTHETKYFYGVPHQEELDQLFGNEAGHALHYKKNMVIDPNGQISLTYQDAKGNTIATALAGNPPGNVLAIPSYASAKVTVTVDLLAHNKKDLDKYALVMQETELVNTRSDYVFNYSVIPAQFNYTECDGTKYCLDCIYDLEFTVIDNLNCGTVKYQNKQTIGQLFKPGGQKFDISLNCDPFVPANPWTVIPSFTVKDLDPGSYTFIKRLSVNEAAADAYVAAVLDTCPTLYNQILLTQYAQMDTSGCEVDCADATSGKNNAAYFAGLSADEQIELNELVTDLCDSLQVSSCKSAWAAMLEDVSPNGQYGAINPVDAPDVFLSVFSPANVLGASALAIAYPNGSNPPLTFSTLTDLEANWQPEWAEKLVQFHPEYCYYQFCVANMEPSDHYNAVLMNIETYADAVTAGYLTGAPINIWMNDPFCNPTNATFNGLVPGYATSILSAINNYKGSGSSMEKMALTVAAYPAAAPANWAAATPIQREKAWPIFRTLYLTNKEEIYYKMRTQYAIQNNCYNECIGDSDFNPFLNGFWNGSITAGNNFWINTPQKNCDIAAYHFFKDKIKRFPSIYDILPDNFSFDFFATPQKPFFDYFYSQYNEVKQEICCDSIFTELPQFLFALYSSGQPSFTLNTAATNNFPDNIEAALLNGATQAQGTLKIANEAYSVNFQSSPNFIAPCRQLQFKFLTPITGTVTSFCCYKEIRVGTAFPGTGIHFQMIASVSGGKTAVIEGIYTQDCPFECPPAPLPCKDLPVKDELLVLFNYLIYQDKLRAGSVSIPSWAVGSNLSAYFGGTGNFTWNAPAGSSIGFTATLMRNNKTCSFNLNQPASHNWLQVDRAETIYPDMTQADVNGKVWAFRLPLLLTGGTRVPFSGNSSCFVLAECCKSDTEIPCTNCPTIRNQPLEPGTILAQILPIDCDPPCEPEEGYTIPISNPCVEQMIAIAQHNAQEIYDDMMESLRADMKAQYMLACLGAAEKFTVTYTDARHHFTLYYYDQANSLVETVPPAGVVPLTSVQRTQVANYRKGLAVLPIYGAHKLVSRYRYNSLNQLKWQWIPDHTAATNFWYDPLSRLIASQNAKQAPTTQYSYTKYDGLGRIVEVAQIKKTTVPPVVSATFTADWATWLNTTDRDQITNTWYDKVALASSPALFPNGQQENLRGRVASVSYNAVPPGGFLTFTNWVHFSYDIHSNVKTMVQANFPLGPKVVEYEYDLVSGNVNALVYQRNQLDQFLHRYAYDADNRLTEVRTSPDGVLWDKEAAYKYYKHGPLARAELGDDRVQGLDFAYTLHGWIKGMNSGALQPQHDMGKDGLNVLPGHFARDGTGYLLGYYDGEYKPIGSTTVTFEPGYAGSNLNAATLAPSLFNGNIRNMVTAIKPFMPGQIPMATMYRYDQLNRLVGMGADGTNFDPSSNKWVTGLPGEFYKNSYSYDANGNIATLNRNGNKTGAQLLMDRQSFNYQLGTNKLVRVADGAVNSNYTEDIDDQPVALLPNYEYDNIGNLTLDRSEKLTYTWNLQGKVSQIDDADAPAKTIQFLYDPLGNRSAKGITNQSATLYAYDASGNVLASYRASAAGVFWESAMLYGSKRLGEYRADKCMGNGCTVAATLAGHFYRFRGKRRYEESNHLGNVLTTVSDRKIPAAGTATTSNFYFENFAVGIAGWTPNNAGILTNSSGKLKISGNNANNGGIVKLPVFPGQTYTLSFDFDFGTFSSSAFSVILVQKVGGSYQNFPQSVTSGNNTYSFTAALESYLIVSLNAAGSKFCLLDNLALTTGGFVAGTVAGYFEGDFVSAQDYYPFGSPMPGRNFNQGDYRYGFNGKENDNEVKGNGNQQDYGMRIYDPRLGRFLSIDPLASLYPWYTPYQFSGNNPVMFIDLDGGEEKKPEIKKNVLISIPSEEEIKQKIYDNVGGNQGNWYIIVAKDFIDANKQFQKYTGGENVDVTVIETHGSLQKGTLALSSTRLITEKTVSKYSKLTEGEAKSNLTALKSIASKTDDKLIINSCLSALGAEGGALANGVGKLINNSVDLYMSQGVTEGAVRDGIVQFSTNGPPKVDANVIMDIPVINFNKKYYDAVGNVHQNQPGQGFIKIAKGSGQITDLGRAGGKNTGNLIFHQNGNTPVEVEKKSGATPIKK